MQTLLHEAARGQPGMKSLQVEEQKWKFKFPLLSAAVHTYIYKKYDIKMALSVRITCSHTHLYTHALFYPDERASHGNRAVTVTD